MLLFVQRVQHESTHVTLHSSTRSTGSTSSPLRLNDSGIISRRIGINQVIDQNPIHLLWAAARGIVTGESQLGKAAAPASRYR